LRVTRADFFDSLSPDTFMNQFRDLTMLAMIILAIALLVGDPDNWGWVKFGGPYAVQALYFLSVGRPWDVIILFALALALFMTRLKY
jgi:hypothetical protein